MKKSQKRKLLVAIVGIVLALAVIAGLIFGIRAIIDRNKADDNGIKNATHKTLKILEENAEKLRDGAEKFYADPDCKYKYPQGQILLVESSGEGKLVVSAEGFNEEALNALIKYSNVEIGADIGITAVVHIVSFDKSSKVNLIESDEEKLKEDIPVVETTDESQDSAKVQKKVKTAADTYLSILKKYLKDNDIKEIYGSIYVYTDIKTRKLEVYPIVIGLSDEQLDEIYGIAAEKISFDEKVGFTKYGYKIDLNNENITMKVEEEHVG